MQTVSSDIGLQMEAIHHRDGEEIGNHWYYFDSRGRLETGWITIKSGTYYLTETGAPGVKRSDADRLAEYSRKYLLF